MSLAREAARVARFHARAVRSVLQGARAFSPGLGSATLDEDDVAIARGLLGSESSWADTAPVRAYQQAFAAWNQSRHAFAFRSGRAALSACIDVLGLGPGCEAIVPGYTCCVVPNAFARAGVGVVYCDIELDTYGPDVASVAACLTSATRAIVIQHLYGLVARDYEAIMQLADLRGIRVIEDCAHATGALYKGRKVGNWGALAFYSSEQSKVFSTGQGGVAVTNDESLADRMEASWKSLPQPDRGWTQQVLQSVILNFYESKHPDRWLSADVATLRYGRHRLVSTTEDELAGNPSAHAVGRMPSPVAQLGLNQLRKLDEYNDRRRTAATMWNGWARAHGYEPPHVVPGSTPVFVRYPLLVEPEKKAELSWARVDPGISPGVWFTSHTHPARRLVAGCPAADKAVAECINFPTLGLP